MRLLLVLSLAACSTVGSREDPAEFRLRSFPPPEPPSPGPVWRTSFDEAEAAAKERHATLLLYFTAKW